MFTTRKSLLVYDLCLLLLVLVEIFFGSFINIWITLIFYLITFVFLILQTYYFRLYDSSDKMFIDRFLFGIAWVLCFLCVILL